MFEQTERIGGILVFALRGARLPNPLYPALEALLAQQVARKTPAVLLDCRGARADLAALGALLEIYRRFMPYCHLAVCGLADPQGLQETSHPITHWLPLFPTRADALACADLRRLRLAGRRVVVLAGARHPGPPSHNVPLGLLPVFGESLLHGVLQGLDSMGLVDITLDCGPNGTEIRAHADRAQLPPHALHPYNNMYSCNEAGSALLALNRDICSFERDCVVLLGNATGIGCLPDVLAAHQAAGCGVSLAIGSDGPAGAIQTLDDLAASEQAFAGIAIFSGGALDGLAVGPGRGLFSALLPEMLQRGQTVQSLHASPRAQLVSDSTIYFNLLRRRLLEKLSVTSGRNVIVEPGARLSRRAQISGPCYIGNGAEVSAGCRISGPTIIESGCRLGRGTEVVGSVLTSLLTSGSGGRLHNVVAAPGWELPIAAANVTPLKPAARQPAASTTAVARTLPSAAAQLAYPTR